MTPRIGKQVGRQDRMTIWKLVNIIGHIEVNKQSLSVNEVIAADMESSHHWHHC